MSLSSPRFRPTRMLWCSPFATTGPVASDLRMRLSALRPTSPPARKLSDQTSPVARESLICAPTAFADQPASDGVVTPDRRPADRVLDAGALGKVHADQPAQAAAVLSGAVAIGDLALETNMGDQAAVLADQTTDGGAVRAGNPARGACLTTPKFWPTSPPMAVPCSEAMYRSLRSRSRTVPCDAPNTPGCRTKRRVGTRRA